jgi:hypothetical protein
MYYLENLGAVSGLECPQKALNEYIAKWMRVPLFKTIIIIKSNPDTTKL